MRNTTTLAPSAWAAQAARLVRSRIEFVKPDKAETNKLEVDPEPLNSHRTMLAAGVGLASLAAIAAAVWAVGHRTHTPLEVDADDEPEL